MQEWLCLPFVAFDFGSEFPMSERAFLGGGAANTGVAYRILTGGATRTGRARAIVICSNLSLFSGSVEELALSFANSFKDDQTAMAAFLFLFGKSKWVDVRQNTTTTSYGNTSKQFSKLFIVPYSQTNALD